MEPNKLNVGTAKDFFLQLGAIITFYASAIALITLVFETINHAYPKITNAYQYYSYPSISFQVATLIVAFPLFLALSWLLQKSYVAAPMLRDSLVRRWLAYITLFVAGAVVAGDLVTLIYTYLDGQELTTGFLLKVLALLVIVGGIFLYYLREIRNVIAPSERNIWRIVAIVVIAGSVVLGFSVVGSPQTQRAIRYDQQRVSDLQNLQWQIVNHWQQKGALPQALEDVRDPLSGYNIPLDPEIEAPYEYEKLGNLSFKLCATFGRETPKYAGSGGGYPRIMPAMMEMSVAYPASKTLDNWHHQAGRTCFERTIDPQLYPPVKR